MQNKYNWGILGFGKIATKFIADLMLSQNSNLHAIATLNPNKQLLAKQNYPNAIVCTSYEDLVNDSNVDIIYIATPHAFHFEHSSLALHAKKHVLCEKPMTLTSKNTRSLFALAKKNNVLLMEGMWTAFLPAIQEVVQSIQNGLLGQIVRIEANFGFTSPFDPQSRLYNKELGGGSLFDIGIYPLFISLLLKGLPSKYAAFGKWAVSNVDSDFSALLWYPDGATSSIYSSFSTTTDTSCTIYGTKGKIVIHSRFHEQSKFTLHIHDSDPLDIIKEKIGLGFAHEIMHFQSLLDQKMIESDIMSQKMSTNLSSLIEKLLHLAH